MTQKNDISFFGQTDIGLIRTNNEDTFVARTLWDEETFLVMAIDGVGGYDGGEIAADIAKNTIPEFLSASPNGERIELLKQAVTAANNAIFEAREADSAHSQMSCVLTSAIIDVKQNLISMVHVGDTRLYSFRDGELKKLSHDHSIIGYREEIGDLTEEEAMQHPQRNIIARDIGSARHKVNDDDFLEAEVFPLHAATILLLCTDGLTDLVTSVQITEILGQDGTLQDKAGLLIQAALDAGGKDNVTVVLLEYQSDIPEVSKTEDTGEPEEVLETQKTNDKMPPTTEDEKTNREDPADIVAPEKKYPSRRIRLVLLFVLGILLGIAAFYFSRTAADPTGAKNRPADVGTIIEDILQKKETLQKQRNEAFQKQQENNMLLDSLKSDWE